MELKKSYVASTVKPFYVGAPAASISRDGRMMVTPLDDDIMITDLENNQVLHEIDGDGETVTSVVITPDGDKAAVLSSSQQLRVFDVESGDQVKAHKLSSPVYICAADPTSTLFAFGGSDGVITVWDIAGGYISHSLKGHGTTVCSLAFFGELGQKDWKLASGDTMGTVKVWDLVKRKCIATVNEHNSAVRGVAFSKSGRLLTAGRDHVAVIYNDRYKAIKTISVGHQVENAGFIDLDTFYTAGTGANLQIWDIDSGSQIEASRAPKESNEELVVIDVIRKENEEFQGYLLILSDQTIVEIDQNLQEIKRIAGNHGTIADIRYIPGTDSVVMATNSPAVRIMNKSTPLEVSILEGHKDLLNAVDVSKNGEWIATAGKDSEARLWKRQNDNHFIEYAVFTGHAGAVTCVCLPKSFSGDVPPFILTGSSDLTVKKWAVKQGLVNTSIYTRRAHEKDINKIDISPNDQFFATASYDKLGKIWNIDSGETIGVLKGHKRGLWDISFCEYDKLIATASGDKSAKIWSLNDFTCKKTLEGHTNSVQRIRFINQNQQLLSAGAEGLIKIWDLKNEEAVQTLDAHDNRIWAFDVAQDGQEFISADADGRISFWVDNSEEVAAAEAQAESEKVEQEQKLVNYIKSSDWSNAFLLALTLNHPMRLHNVLKSCIGENQDPESILGSFNLEETIKTLQDDQILLLFQRIREWNVNSRSFEIAQKLLQALLKIFNSSKLIEIKGINHIIEGILVYSERHFGRIENVVEDSYMLDWVVDEMR